MSDDLTRAQLEKAVQDARKAKADADAAEAAAAKAAREEAEASSPAAAARRDAVAEKDAAAARQAQVAALIPDFSKVERGELKVEKGGEPTAGTAVAGRALKDAAERLKDEVTRRTGSDDWSMLITSEAELAGSDAAYHSTRTALVRLTTWADNVLTATAGEAGKPSKGAQRFAPAAAAAVASAVAQAVPGVLSLLSAHRTVTTGTIVMEDIAAAAAVADVIKGGNAKRKVFHDSFRTLPWGELGGMVDTLYAKRDALIERKVALEARKPSSGDASAELKEAIGLVGSAVDSIGTLLSGLTTVATGATRSPLAAALLRQGLHDGSFGYALLVKAESASGLQLVNDKPLWSKDTFMVAAAASITWILIDAKEGGVLDAGVTTGTAQAFGNIGERFEFD